MAAREDPGHIPNHFLQFVSPARRANSYDPAWFCVQGTEVGQGTGES